MISNEELIGYKIAGNRDSVIILSYDITTNNYGLYLIKTTYPMMSISASCNYNKTKATLLYPSLDGYLYSYMQ